MDQNIRIMRFRREHSAQVAALLVGLGWEARYIDGQIRAIESLSADQLNGRVFVALEENAVVGFISVEFYQWNRLAQIHGLAVAPAHRRRGIAAKLVRETETFVQSLNGRGIYVDTPVTNEAARRFYTAQGYAQDYIMTAYYANDLDGVTYLKLFTSRR